MNMPQSNKRRFLSPPLAAGIFFAALVLGGCATERPIALQGLEQRIENARTEADHRDIAAVYEQQASTDKASAEKHRKFAEAYAKSWTQGVPWTRGAGNVPKGNPAMVKHCENLANLYEQAAKTNLELAAEHRRAAVGNTK